MSLTLSTSSSTDIPSNQFYIHWKVDWEALMIQDFLQDYEAKKDQANYRFEIPMQHFLFFQENLATLNQKITQETLQVLGRPIRSLPTKKYYNQYTKISIPKEEVVRLQRLNPAIYRYRESPFCLCFPNERQSIECDFCKFACCEKAIKTEMCDQYATCPVHGPCRLEIVYS